MLSTGHRVVRKNSAWVLNFTVGAKVLHTHRQIALVIDNFVTLVKWGSKKNMADILSLSSSVSVLRTSVKKWLSWSLLALNSLPLGGKFDSVSFNIIFWCQKFVRSSVVEVTTKTGNGSLEVSWSSAGRSKKIASLRSIIEKNKNGANFMFFFRNLGRLLFQIF